MRRNILFLLLFFCLTSANGHVVEKIQNHYIQQIDLPDIDKSLPINTIYKDSNGYLWFSSLFGLYRYDGNKIKVFNYNANDSLSIPHNYIIAMRPIDKDRFLCGSYGASAFVFNSGIGRIEKVKFIEDSTDIANRLRIYNISKGLSQNSYWVSTIDGLLYKFNAKNNTFSIKWRATQNEKINNAYGIVSMTEILDEKMVYKIHDSFYLINLEQINSKPIEINETLVKNLPRLGKAVECLFINNDLSLVYENGIVLLNGNTLEIKKILHTNLGDYKNEAITNLISLDDNSFLLSTNNSFYILDSDFTIKESTKLGSIKGIIGACTDKEGDVWIASISGGIYYFSPNKSHFKYLDFGNFPNVLAITEFIQYNQSEWLIGTNAGLFIYNFQSNQVNQIRLSTKQDFIECLHKSKSGKIWIGTIDGNLIEYDTKDKKILNRYSKPNLEKEWNFFSRILDIHEDKYGRFWISTYENGVLILNPKTNEFYKLLPAESVKFRSSLSMTSDVNGNIWLASLSGGVFVFDNQKDWSKIKILKHITTQVGDSNSLSFHVTTDIKKDSKDNFWVGTVSGGCNYIESETDKVNRFQADNGFPAAMVYRSEEDQFGQMWFSSDNGLIRFNRKDNQISHFRISDGLLSNSFNFQSSIRFNDSILAFGSGKTILYFKAFKDLVNRQTPAIVDVKLFNQSINHVDNSVYSGLLVEAEQFTFNHKQYIISFDLTNFDLIDNNKFEFAYQMDGVDKGWNHIKDRKTITYTNLKPGKYKLRIRAADHTGAWSINERIYTIVVTPPWWETWWAYLSYILIFLLALRIFSKYRERNLRAEKEKLEKTVEVRTEELVQKNIVVENQKRIVEEQKEILQEKNNEIYSSIRYASTIQNAILPWDSTLRNAFGEILVLYKPKDIVSGDSYWFKELDGIKFLAVIDCTGHGIPGAMLTVIASTALDDAVLGKRLTDTSQILTYMNEKVTEVLNQRLAENSIRDGMEVALIAIHQDKIQFSGAGRPLYIKNGTMEIIKIDKRGIAGQTDNDEYQFSSIDIEKTENLVLYLTSDGFADQMNESSKKYSTKRFVALLDSFSDKPVSEQHEILENEFNSHKGNREQIDDVTIIGVKL